MPEKRWRFEADTQVLREARRSGTTAVADTVMLDVRDLGTSSWNSRRSVLVGPADVDDREALAATALAAHQASTQAPSVLDVDARSLRIPRIRLRQEVPAREEWTPPTTLPVDLEADPVPAASSRADAEAVQAKGRRSRTRRVLVAGFVGTGLIGLLAGALFFTVNEREGEAVETAAPAAAAPAVDPATAQVAGGVPGAEPVVRVEGLLEFSEVNLRTGSDGAWSEPSSTFTTGQPVSLWLAFDYAQTQGESHRLSVAWFRDDTELARPSFELTSSAQGTAIAAPPLDEPGDYRADVLLNDQVITSVPFQVAPVEPPAEEAQG